MVEELLLNGQRGRYGLKTALQIENSLCLDCVCFIDTLVVCIL